MVSVPKALTGKKVYSGGSYAPSKGTNAPSGYLQRELSKRGVSRVGGDGQSDTRSGLASRALSQHPTLGGSGWGGQIVRAQVGHSTPGSAPSRPPSNNFGSRPSGPSSAPASSPFTPAQAPVQVQNNGQLTLPYDYESAMGSLHAHQDADTQLEDLQYQGQQAAAEYLRNLRDVGKAYGKTKQSRLNDYSARGVAYSSGYGNALAEDATAYNTTVNDLNTEHSTYESYLAGKRNTIGAYLQQYLQQAALQQAYLLEQQQLDGSIDGQVDNGGVSSLGAPALPTRQSVNQGRPIVNLASIPKPASKPAPAKSTSGGAKLGGTSGWAAQILKAQRHK